MNYYGDPSMNETSFQSQGMGTDSGFDHSAPDSSYSNPSMHPTIIPHDPAPQGAVAYYSEGGEVEPTIIPHDPAPHGSVAYYSHGGEVHRRGMEDVYMSPREIIVMDKLQGDHPKSQNYDKDGVKNYTKLWHMLKSSPHLMRAGWHGHYKELDRQSHAHGGQADDAPEGRFGDTKRIRIPKKMADMLDHVLKQTGHHPSRNPKTGHREYYGLNGFFNGVGQRLGIPPSNPSTPSAMMGSQIQGNQSQMGSMTPQSPLGSQQAGSPMGTSYARPVSQLRASARSAYGASQQSPSFNQPSRFPSLGSPLA